MAEHRWLRSAGSLLLAVLVTACASAPYRVKECQPQLQREAVYHPLDHHGQYAVSRYLAGIPVRSDSWWDWSSAMAEESASVLGVAVAPCNWLASNEGRDRLGQQIHFPDEYSLTLRTLGLYPLSRLPFVAGVKRELANTASHYREYRNRPLPPDTWRLYGVAEADMALKDASALIDVRFRAALASDVWQRFAPQFAIEQGPAPLANQPGLPVREAGVLQWQDRPVIFGYASPGQYRGRQTLQLNYQIWFRARPASARFDPLAGQLDGIHWRVHLDESLQPLAYDAMHTCGCWYQVFPAAGYEIEVAGDFWQEPVYVGGVPPVVNPMLVITADSHSLVGVRRPGMPEQALQPVQLAPALVGSRQPLVHEAKSHRQLFAADGTVPESTRSERYFFWPMGIHSAGSMRAPGRHAIAFTGRRHFDDPTLLDSLGLNRQHRAQVVD